MVAVHWDKWKSKWRCYEGLTYRLMEQVYLKDVFFFVQPEGRDKVREARKAGASNFDARFPHAFAFGTLIDYVPQGRWISMNYNPFANDFFVRLDTGQPITHVAYAYFDLSAKGKVIPAVEQRILSI